MGLDLAKNSFIRNSLKVVLGALVSFTMDHFKYSFLAAPSLLPPPF